MTNRARRLTELGLTVPCPDEWCGAGIGESCKPVPLTWKPTPPVPPPARGEEWASHARCRLAFSHALGAASLTREEFAKTMAEPNKHLGIRGMEMHAFEGQGDVAGRECLCCKIVPWPADARRAIDMNKRALEDLPVGEMPLTDAELADMAKGNLRWWRDIGRLVSDVQGLRARVKELEERNG